MMNKAELILKVKNEKGVNPDLTSTQSADILTEAVALANSQQRVINLSEQIKSPDIVDTPLLHESAIDKFRHAVSELNDKLDIKITESFFKNAKAKYDEAVEKKIELLERFGLKNKDFKYSSTNPLSKKEKTIVVVSAGLDLFGSVALLTHNFDSLVITLGLNLLVAITTTVLCGLAGKYFAVILRLLNVAKRVNLKIRKEKKQRREAKMKLNLPFPDFMPKWSGLMEDEDEALIPWRFGEMTRVSDDDDAEYVFKVNKFSFLTAVLLVLGSVLFTLMKGASIDYSESRNYFLGVVLAFVVGANLYYFWDQLTKYSGIPSNIQEEINGVVNFYEKVITKFRAIEVRKAKEEDLVVKRDEEIVVIYSDYKTAVNSINQKVTASNARRNQPIIAWEAYNEARIGYIELVNLVFDVLCELEDGDFTTAKEALLNEAPELEKPKVLIEVEKVESFEQEQLVA